MVDVLITEHMKRGLGQCRPRLRGGRGFVSGLPPRRSLWERHCFHMTYHRKKRAFSTAGTLAEAVAGFLRGSGRPQQLVTLWPCFPLVFSPGRLSAPLCLPPGDSASEVPVGVAGLG